MHVKLFGEIVRRARILPKHRPFPIFVSPPSGEPPRPIDPDWACVVYRRDGHVPPDFEQFELAFYLDDGTWLDGITCDTLDIALDQARGFGIKPGDWEEVRLAEPDRPGESRLTDWSPADAFPSGLRSEAMDHAFLACIPPSDLPPLGQFTVVVGVDEVHIPYRIYNPFPQAKFVTSLSETKRRMIDCVYSRHHDGHIRQACLERIVGLEDPWVVPFVVRLLGEYVVEIVEVIADGLADSPEGRDRYRAFCASNPAFVQRTKARAISYWDCYYRLTYPRFEDYPAHRILEEICGHRPRL